MIYNYSRFVTLGEFYKKSKRKLLKRGLNCL